MSHDRDRQGERGSSADSEAARSRPAPGKTVSTSALRGPVQAFGGAVREPTRGSVGETAARGAEGTGGRLPHFDLLQRAFGHHDLSGVTAHTGGAAAEATSALGANAYTQGNRVVLGGDASLRTVAHEAAHAVQQRSGMSLAGGVGAAGDAHEAHADAVADRVVAGESAAPLLDGYGGPSAGAPAAAPIQFELRRGTDAAASASIVRQVAAGDNVFQMRALLRALQQAHLHRGAAAPPVEHVVCVGGGDNYDLRIDRTQLDELERLLQAGVTRVEAAATGGTPEGEAPAGDTFSRGFNTAFGPILPALRAAVSAPAPEGTPDSGDYSAAELRLLLTAGQRAALSDYFTSHAIPDRLFTREHGGFTAQQRILLSGHILVNGEYAPGSFMQRMHARMCGHWVEMANAYAGCSADGGAGVETNFDHAGNVVLGSGGIEHEYSGESVPIPEGGRTGHREFTQTGIPVAEYEARIRPGDWLYLFTNTDTRGGNHSVIFVRWASEIRPQGEVSYRRAVVMGQSAPDRGGSETEWSLGSAFEVVDGSPVFPVTVVMRHPGEAHAAETVDDVVTHELGLDANAAEPAADPGAIPELGSGPGARGNFTTIQQIERRLHGRVDFTRLRAQIRERNAAKLADLEASHREGRGSRITEEQRLLLAATNERDDLETLVRLNERLRAFDAGADALTAAETGDRATRIDTEHMAHAEEIETNLRNVSADIAEVEAAIAAETELVGMDRRVHQLERAARSARTEVNRLTHARDRARRESARASLTARLDRATAHLDEVERQLAELRAAHDPAAERELERRHAVEDEFASGAHGVRFRDGLNSRQRLGRLTERMRELLRSLSAIEADGGYHTAQLVGGDAFRGRIDGERERTTGLFSNVREPIEWAGTIEPGVTGHAEAALGRRREATAEARRPRRGH
ncbi:MAG: DUF4157 domain-containing protein [Myxococcales bacterium]|nr:DUF4157 domain-containing protein [Myxococcales bacterium]